MKKTIALLVVLTMALGLFAGCGNTQKVVKPTMPVDDTPTAPPEITPVEIDGTNIILSDEMVLVDGVTASDDNTQAVYIAHDIVYYEEGHDFTYGEGTETDEHSKDEADKHLVVHIAQPGNYILNGTLSAGQIAIDLGDDAKENPNAVVNLYLNGVNITNTVAPAVIFYNVFEPFNDVDTDTAKKDVDTSSAGANVFIIDGTENNITGSHVARIYKPDSVVLNEDGTEVVDEKKLHKYDAAFYSKMTMNIEGDKENTGVLNITADNEGLDSEMHLTINGGVINITSGNDGINTNEDGISVTTVNGGIVNIMVTGSTGEGDGIDSNGWLVINGGAVFAQACGFSGDSGIDSDMGIHINGGIVAASGNMLDRISESTQTYAVFTFDKFLGEGTYALKNNANETVASVDITNDFTILILSSPNMVDGEYTLWYNDAQLVGASGEGGFGRGMGPAGEKPINEGKVPPDGMTPPEGFEGEPPEGFTPGQMMPPEGMTPPEGNLEDGIVHNEDGTITLPDGTIIDPEEIKSKLEDIKGDKPADIPNETRPNKEHGGREGVFGENVPNQAVELTETFVIKNGANYFSFIQLK